MKRRLDMHDFTAAMLNVSYLPGWYMRLYQHGDEGPGIQFIVELANTYRTGQVTLDIRSVIPPCHSFEEFYDWLHWRLGCIALHERSEWFKVNGQAWVDPHSEQYIEATRTGEINGNTQGRTGQASSEEGACRTPSDEPRGQGQACRARLAQG